MSRSRDIARQCKEFKAELQAGTKRTFVDLLLEWIGRGKPAPVIIGILVFVLLPSAIGFVLAAILGEVGLWQDLFRTMWSGNPLEFLWAYFGLITATASMFIANVYFHKIMVVIRDHLLDVVESEETLERIKHWVDFLCNKKIAWIVAAVGGLLSVPIVVANFDGAVGFFVGIGYTVTLFFISAQSSLFFGFLLGTLGFAFNLRYFELTLFESDPAHSEVIARLSGSLNWFVYFVAIYGAVQTSGIVTLKLSYFVYILFVFWFAIIGVFVLSQYGLAQIIQRVKWRTLNKCQQEITEFRGKKSALSEEDREQLNWLLDYHDRVTATRNSAFDVSAGLSFLNSLLLPLIGFLLGNVDVILKFLR